MSVGQSARAESIDELIGGCSESFVLFSGDPRVFGMGLSFSSIRAHSSDELVAWLESKGVPQLLDGSYWREFADVAIHGMLDAELTPPGAADPTPCFRVTMSRQKPKPISEATGNR